jgi:hypothetical protein
VIVGLTRFANKGHIARAALEATAYQTRDLVEAMLADTGLACLNQLRVDGGMTKNELLMQFQADILGSPVAAPAIAEITATGAALPPAWRPVSGPESTSCAPTTPSRGAGNPGWTTTRAAPEWRAGAEASTERSGWLPRSRSAQAPRNGREPGLPTDRQRGRLTRGGGVPMSSGVGGLGLSPSA